MFEEPTEPTLKVTMELSDLVNRIEHWKREARGFRQQMEINLREAESCETALKKIISICSGESWDKPGVLQVDKAGFVEDLEDAALRLVKEKLEQKTPSA